MTPFRQLILPGDVGTDVRAVKRAFRKIGIAGSGGLVLSNRAGPAFVTVLQRFQRQHNLTVDGKYGRSTHALVAPHFDLYGAALYRKAGIRSRTPPVPPVWAQTSAEAAQRILAAQAKGKYRADNPGDLRDLQATAAGKAVWSQGGYWVHIDHRPLELVVWLIEAKGHEIGTFAFCSDHMNDGPHGHAGGLAVDISSIDGEGVVGGGMHDRTKKVAEEIRSAPFVPRQLICGGSGNVFYSDIESLCIPSPGFYGWPTLAGHRNHIHAGY